MNEKNKAYLSMCTAMLIFGTMAILRRFIPLSSGMLAFVRGLLGALVLLLFVAVKRHPLPKIGKKQFVLLAVTGALIGVNWIVLFESYSYTSVATATMCFYMQPTITILLSPIVFRERLTGKKLLCAFAAIVGMLFVSGAAEGGGIGAQDVKGIILGLCAAGMYAVVIILNKRIRVEDAYEKTIVQLASAALALIPYLLLTEDFAAIRVDARTMILMLVVGVVHSGIAYVLYFDSIKKLRAQSIAVLSYIDPVSTLFLSAFILHERLSVLGVLGAVLIIGSALVSELKIKKAAVS